MARTPRLDEYTILLLCPLLIEQQAACLMLDEVHDGIPERSIGQTVLYILGRISSYNVAIAGYPAGEVGIGISGSIISEALRDFPNLELGLLVGIAAGLPSATRDIRLGDVAVAIPNKSNTGIIGYDLVKIEDEEVLLKQWQNATHPLLRSAIASIQVRTCFPGEGFTRHLNDPKVPARFQRVATPLASEQWSTKPSQRKPSDGPEAHYGTILSGNAVIKSRKRRDELRDKYDGIAIEMEAAGMMTRLPVAVIRGISDFANSGKNDEWHPYAAITAAAYAKEILIRLGPRKDDGSALHSVMSPNLEARLGLTLPEQCHFVGRERELTELYEWLGFHRQKPLQRSIITLWGLSGAGKSQLVAELVRRAQRTHPTYDIFWIAGESKETFEKSIIRTLALTSDPTATHPEAFDDHDVQRAMLIKSFFTELQSPTRSRWLLVVDGVSGTSSLEYFRSYLDLLPSGSIILTSRSKEVADRFLQRMEVKGLLESDAFELLQSQIDDSFMGEKEEVLELARMLNGHPLSLKLAISVISCSHQTVGQYISRWRKRQLDSENLPTDPVILSSFKVSFAELEHRNYLAAELLTLFSFLDHRDLWCDLCRDASDKEYPNWLCRLADQHTFRQACIQLCNYSFAEAKPHGSKQCSYELHPAVPEFARWNAKDKAQTYVRFAISLVAAKVPRSTDKDFVMISRRLEPHADQCRIHLECGRVGRGLDLLELAQFGNLYRLVGRHAEASRLYQGILNILARNVPSPSTLELIATVGNNLGLVYHAQRKYRHALQSFDQTLQSLSMEDADNSMSTLYNKGRSLLMLGELDSAQQDLLSAADHFSEAVERRVFKFDNHKRLEKLQFYVRILNDLGEIYFRKGDRTKAEELFKQAFDIQNQQLNVLHPAAFAIRLNIGRVCIEQSRFASARQIFNYIIATYTEWWGRRHPETMRAIDELAHSYMRQGQLKRLMGEAGDEEMKIAADLWTETLGFYQETYGNGSDIVNAVMEKLESLNSRTEDPYAMYYSSTSFKNGGSVRNDSSYLPGLVGMSGDL